ncbi:MAG TPA: hypothetical protein VFO65_02510, partial [Acidimicrobiales bacterium]|nr:hypothetical protein [Acidimicrobiales bacterium]
CYAPRRAPAELGWQARVDLAEGLPGAVEGAPAPAPAPAAKAPARPAWAAGPEMEPAACPGSSWERFIEDHDEGIGSVYERFVLNRVIDDALAATGSTSILHGPAFGMAGVPGLDAIFQARAGLPVGLVDVNADRLAAVVGLWDELGCRPDATWVAPWPDTSGWADVVPAGRYDLVLSFAALWWCARPWEVLAAQARWAGKAVLLCIPNRNVFMQVRSRFWHQDMFEHLNPIALDFDTVVREAGAVGLELADTGLFDIPPFPDTAISIKELIPAFGRRTSAQAAEGEGEAAWRWEIVPYLKGEDPGLEDRIAKIGFLEDRVGGLVARKWAHHRYYLFVPSSATQRR